jgi:hypothetical protein
MAAPRQPGDGVGIQVPAGRIAANRTHWQSVLEARDKPGIYRLCNAPRSADEAANAMIVEVDGAKRTIKVNAGGWYVLVS